jgi:hypothetical protein
MKKIFLKIGFLKELNIALISVQKPLKFNNFIIVVYRVIIDLK